MEYPVARLTRCASKPRWYNLELVTTGFTHLLFAYRVIGGIIAYWSGPLISMRRMEDVPEVMLDHGRIIDVDPHLVEQRHLFGD